MSENILFRLRPYCGTLISVQVNFSTMRLPTLEQITFISSMGVEVMILSSSSKTGQAEAEH